MIRIFSIFIFTIFLLKRSETVPIVSRVEVQYDVVNLSGIRRSLESSTESDAAKIQEELKGGLVDGEEMGHARTDLKKNPPGQKEAEKDRIQDFLEEIERSRKSISEFEKETRKAVERNQKILEDGDKLTEEFELLFYPPSKSEVVKRGFGFHFRTFLWSIVDRFKKIFNFKPFNSDARAEIDVHAAYRHHNRIVGYDKLTTQKDGLNDAQKVIHRLVHNRGKYGSKKKKMSDSLAVHLHKSEDLETIADPHLKSFAQREKVAFDKEYFSSKFPAFDAAKLHMSQLKSKDSSYEKVADAAGNLISKDRSEDDLEKLAWGQISELAMKNYNERMKKESTKDKSFLKKLSAAMHFEDPVQPTEDAKMENWGELVNDLSAAEKAYVIAKIEDKTFDKLGKNKKNLRYKDWLKEIPSAKDDNQNSIDSAAKDFDTLSTMLRKRGGNAEKLLQFDVLKILSEKKGDIELQERTKLEASAHLLRKANFDCFDVMAILKLAQPKKNKYSRSAPEASLSISEFVEIKKDSAEIFLSGFNESRLNQAIGKYLIGSKSKPGERHSPYEKVAYKVAQHMRQEEKKKSKDTLPPSNDTPNNDAAASEIAGKIGTYIFNNPEVMKKAYTDEEKFIGETEKYFLVKKALHLKQKEEFLKKINRDSYFFPYNELKKDMEALKAHVKVEARDETTLRVKGRAVKLSERFDNFLQLLEPQKS